MNQWPTTRNTLLVNLAGEQYQSAWFEFTQLYEPVIYRFARKRGLQHVDAVDLTQQVMLSVMKSARRWAEEHPPDRFRAWLKTVASNSLINMVTRDDKYRAIGSPSDAHLAEHFSASDEGHIWATEESRAILRSATTLIRDEFSTDSWFAFEQTLLHGRTVDSVAKSLNKSKGSIYAARARIVRRLKQESLRMLESQVEEAS